MKLCKDCKHLRQVTLECSKNHSISPVTGNKLYSNAHTYRHSDSYCGVKAIWFEPIIEITEDLDDLSTIPFGR